MIMLPEHKWEFRVFAGSYYVSFTQDMGGNDIGLNFENDELGYQKYGYSYHIDELEDNKHIATRLYSLQLLLNGAMRISWASNNHAPIKFIDFRGVNGGTTHEVYADFLEEYPFSKNPDIDHCFAKHSRPEKTFTSLLFHKSKTHEALRILLFQAGLISVKDSNNRIITWGTLYKMNETIKYFSYKNNISYDNLQDQSKINDFTAACNNISVLGVYARHGIPREKPPSSVITDIDEAIQLILDMANLFAHQYLSTII